MASTPRLFERAVVVRRRALATMAFAGLLPRRAISAPSPWSLQVMQAAEPMRQIHAGGPSGLLAIGASGALWALSPVGAVSRLVTGLDPATPLATGHGRIAARTVDGGLWVWERGQALVAPGAGLVRHAGLLILPMAVIGIAADGATHRLVRLERDAASSWRETARSAEPVLPDARPLSVDLDDRGDGGHVVVLAGADSTRYDHGVLGDAFEATRLLWLERHGLKVLRELSLPAPYVFEDIAPRAVALARGTGLLTMRSGPAGAQLALVAADPRRADGLRLAALGDTVGGRHRWLAPTTDGERMLAVHTPHLGGVLHEYALQGERLAGRRIRADVSTHRIGSRETDLAVWRGSLLVLPSQDGTRLHGLDAAANWAEMASISLPARVVQTRAATGTGLLAALLESGQVVQLQGS